MPGPVIRTDDEPFWMRVARRIGEIVMANDPQQAAPQPARPADPMQALQKAQTIGPSKVGERYVETDAPPTLMDMARRVVGGDARPRSVAAQDPYGIQAWQQGNAPMPALMMAGTAELPPVKSPAQVGMEYLAEKFPKVAAYIKAYHGSPHDFERFDARKIGTGEGAQSYGHGLYFAEHEPVAQQYKKVLGNRAFKVGDRELVSPMGGSTRALDTQTRGENIATQALDDAFNAQSSSPAQFAASRLRKQAQLYPEESAHIDEALKVISEWQKTGEVHKMGGRMYEVAIKAHPDEFLDWDKPLSEQPPSVQKFMRSVETEPGLISVTDADGTARHYRFGADRQRMTGAGLYQAASKLKGGPDAATEALREAGIPGIKYLDQGSRGGRLPYRGDSAFLHAAESVKQSGASADDALALLKQSYKGADASVLQSAVHEAYDITPQTRNYVVFDDRLIDIMKKYGVVLPLGAGMAALSQQGQSSQATK